MGRAMNMGQAFLPLAAVLASCGMPSTATGGGQAVENTVQTEPVPSDERFAMEVVTRLDQPWAMAFVPGTGVLAITTKPGKIVAFDTRSRRAVPVSGAPQVAYGGQGGLGDIAFLPSEAADTLTSRTVYLSWAEPGPGDTRGAAVGRGTLACEEERSCEIRDLAVIWRQEPKVTGRGHYSHRIALSPDERYLFVSSGDRQKQDPAQDTASTLGTIVRLLPDGSPAPGNPLAEQGGADPAIWTWGHRNILGLAFAPDGRLWAAEHGPKGGDELNLIVPGRNYGWPLVSNGRHYNGRDIPDHAARPDLAAPAISWDPVIAPGDLLFTTHALFPDLAGHALITGLKSEVLVEVAMDGDKGKEVARYDFGTRIRALAEGPDGAIWVAEDGPRARLWRLAPGQAP